MAFTSIELNPFPPDNGMQWHTMYGGNMCIYCIYMCLGHFNKYINIVSSKRYLNFETNDLDLFSEKTN